MKYILSIFSIAGFLTGLGFVVFAGKSLLWIMLAFAGLGFLVPIILVVTYFAWEERPISEETDAAPQPAAA